ncbi:spore coat protein [Amycolatopsis sp. SID8362]|uniref:spore coat protein n=1 Tax=Amycolatopsis sp. SID8362 TaxID=2690346 RepID=UPI001367AD29|nr:spore coat protein [Amycolatopsis sp. SID8362]NBH08378.1 spore coat protein [Amycolatopsis sp. SID8362]NED45072.1 spore coat protein [Amycolatopsis sp. SID8362]
MRLLLRADASASIGAGHIARMVAYAERAVARGFSVSFAGQVDNAEWLASRFDELGVARVPFDATGFDAVVVDHYGLGDVRSEVNAAGAVLVSIEDDVFGRRPADIVVDSSFAPSPRPDDGSDVLLRGIEYAPLRDVVRQTRRAPAGPPLHVTVVLGGGAEWTSTVGLLLRALRDTEQPFVVDALVRGEPEVPSLLPGQSIRVAPPSPALLDILATTDVAVSASGVTFVELCCLGVPTAAVRLVDNQEPGYRAALELGLAAGLGPAETLASRLPSVTAVLRSLLTDAALRRSLSATASSTVDGLGVDRVLDSLASRTGSVRDASYR